jgi:hypothetical protein
MSNTPHIKGTSTTYEFNLSGCNDLNIEKVEYCGLGTYCDMYKTRDGCVLRTDENARDWPCIWIIEDKENIEIEKCISEWDLNCSDFTMEFKCLYVNNKMLEGENLKCFWDITDVGGKCKAYISENEWLF